MKDKVRKWAVILTAAALLLTGCGTGHGKTAVNAPSAKERQPDETIDTFSDVHLRGRIVKFADMEYIRPEMDELEELLHAVSKAADGSDPAAVEDAVLDFYDAYDRFYTAYSISDIYYSGDLTDSRWEEENSFCVSNAPEADAMLDELYYILAASPVRAALETDEYFGEGFFEAYDGESVYDAETLSLMEQEAALQNQYYSLQGSDFDLGSEEYYDDCAEEQILVLADLIRVRNRLAAHLGYDSYPEFAGDWYYYRDYTAEQSDCLLEEIRTELVPLYREAAASGDVWDLLTPCTENETLAFAAALARALGGDAEKAFALMMRGELYDIAYSDHKYNSSFETWITSYGEPFLFMNPEGDTYDWLTIAHEFGHFCNDYACGGAANGIDVAEFFSQGMEYLALCYGGNTEDLTEVKLADSLAIYVEQACYAAFEQRMYGLADEELTVEGLCGLYERTALEYGFDAVGYDPREFVTVTHFYTNPMYIISYIVSNDAAMQIYEMELAHSGSGLECYMSELDSEEPYFMAFLEEAGLEDPFGKGHMAEVRSLFEERLL